MSAKKEVVWVQFAAAALSTMDTRLILSKPDETAHMAAKVADKLIKQWNARFSDAAFLLEGQSECANCKKPIGEDDDWVPSADCVKFCSRECLAASGREE